MKYFRLNILFLFSLVFFVASGSSVHAATISILPNSSSVTAGNILTVNVLVNTQGQVINNTDSVIQFPTDLLQVLSVDNKSSIFTLWVENPSFNNSTGQITFNGGVPNPGYQGSAGQVVSITFRTKSVGVASILVGESSVRLNDGLGTDVLTGKSNASVTILSAEVAPPVKTVELKVTTTPILNTIQISSKTHPEEDKWYSKKDVTLSWSIPTGATSVQTFLGSRAGATPTVLYSPPITSKDIASLDDGIWYFNIRYQKNGEWSPTSYFKIQIDSVAPTNVVLSDSKDSQGHAVVDLSATDKLSGVDHFIIQVDGGSPVKISSSSFGKAQYTLDSVSVGDHVILVKAYDKAGNEARTTGSVYTDKADSIVWDSYPKNVRVGKIIEATGQTSIKNAVVSISLTSPEAHAEVYKVQSDDKGNYAFKSSIIEKAGEYVLQSQVLGSSGSVVVSSNEILISVSKPVLIQIGSYTTSLLSVLVPLIGLLILLILIMYYGWHKFFALRGDVNAELEQTKTKIHKAFKTLSDEATSQLLEFEKKTKTRTLSPKEKEAVEHLQDTIAQVDKYLESIVDKIKEGKKL